jgi:DNA-binding response OmpR family regulator
MRNLNHIFTRNEIYAAAWPSDSVVSARAIDTNISRLRKKVGQTMGYHIVSRSGFGYGLMEKL